MSTPENRPIDRSTADRIIQRALQLDAERADGLTEAQVREIAAELSVSTAAVDQALAEQRAGSNPADSAVAIPSRPAVRWYSRTSTFIATIVIVGLIVAMVSRLFVF
jgi:hypothetical protein